MLVGENCAAMVVSLFACSLAGAWQVVNANAAVGARSRQHPPARAAPAHAVHQRGFVRRAREHAETAGATPAALPAWGGGVDASLANRPRRNRQLADAVATLIYTSGTTGAQGRDGAAPGLLHSRGYRRHRGG